MPSILEQYRIADLVDWYEQGKLELSPHFQRGAVWTPPARTYLIDTIIRQLPMPKVFMRTRIDARTRQAVREIVDGQQRLRAVFDFVADKMTLGPRAGEYAGLRFSDLEVEDQESFLGYSIAVDQLVNASNEDVLEVFARINSYSVPLNPAETRHATYQGDFKWTVRAVARHWTVLWDRFQVVSIRNRVRMQDDSLVAEMFGILLEGVQDGGQKRIDGLYKKYDSNFTSQDEVLSKISYVLQIMVSQLLEPLEGTALLRAPHFLLLYAACARVLVGIPKGSLPDGDWYPMDQSTLAGDASDRLLVLAAALEGDGYDPELEPFVKASMSTTHRIASRAVRFPFYLEAVSGT